MKKIAIYFLGTVLLLFTVAFTLDLQWRQVRLGNRHSVGIPGVLEQFYYPPTPSEEAFVPTITDVPEITDETPEPIEMVLKSETPIIPKKWKSFTSKRASFIYPEGAEVTAEKQYLTGECNVTTAECGKLTVKFKGIEFLHQPCTECSPGFYTSYTGKAVMIYGNNGDGILRTFATLAVPTDEGFLELTYFGIHNGILVSIPVYIKVPFVEAERYFYIADKMAASMLNKGKDIGALPEAKYYPVVYSDDCTEQTAEDGSVALTCINNVELLGDDNTVFEKFPDNSTAILSPNGEYLALGNSTFFNLKEQVFVAFGGKLQLEYVGYDQDSLGSWITPEIFLVRNTLCQVDPLIYCKTNPAINVKTGTIEMYSRDKADELYEATRNTKYQLSNWY